jgi:hypothetical protein
VLNSAFDLISPQRTHNSPLVTTSFLASTHLWLQSEAVASTIFFGNENAGASVLRMSTANLAWPFIITTATMRLRIASAPRRNASSGIGGLFIATPFTSTKVRPNRLIERDA